MLILFAGFGGSLALGMYFLLAEMLQLPTIRTTQAMSQTVREKKRLAKTIDVWLMDGAVWLSGYLKLEVYQKGRLQNILKGAGIEMAPEVYLAYAYLKTALVLLLLPFCLMGMPLLAVFVVVLAGMVYFRETGKADDMLREKRERIEGELYRFVSTIEQELRGSRDVMAILEHYKKNAGKEFRQELDTLCADMRSSSYEAALTRFEARLNSPQLSDIVRGLIGVLRGDDGAVYFQMLAHDFKQAELRRLKEKAGKVPPKIRAYSMLLLVCFLMTYFVVIGYEIVRSLGTMF